MRFDVFFIDFPETEIRYSILFKKLWNKIEE